ncbi:MAG: TonB-dependent receptor domain-containing protein [bacterium]
MVFYRWTFFQMLFASLAVVSLTRGQPTAKIVGTVRDVQNNPLPFVNVFLNDGLEGDMSDAEGRFEIQVRKTGRRVLLASRVGYESVLRELEIGEGETIELSIVLKATVIEMDEVVVTASSFTASGEEEGVTLTALEVVTTPGTAADLFRAIKTFPGLAQVDEGAGLFVRGGEVTEVVVFLDQATVAHPYKYESPAGGFFGTINPFLLKGTYFSSGGFSAKYGDALSGVLAMESLDMPVQKSVHLGLSLATASIFINLPVVYNRLGLRLSGNRSFTKLLFDLNGNRQKFSPTPHGRDTNLSLHYDYSPTGRVKLFGFQARDRIGMEAETPAYTGLFTNSETNRLYNLTWTDLIAGKLLLKSSLSMNRFQNETKLGAFEIETDDLVRKFRLDGSRAMGQQLTLNAGGEIEKARTHLTGALPRDENDLSPGAEVHTIGTLHRTTRYGGYLEIEAKLTKRVYSVAGLRLDYQDPTKQTTVDPRLSLGYRLSNNHTLKAAWGVYHQYPQAIYHDPGYGNPQLDPKQAIHYILGYEYNYQNTKLHLEAYYKDYDNLLLEDPVLNFTNNGYGYAYGVDLFLKGSRSHWDGWMSYSYLSARRKEFEFTELASPDFDITHNLTLVAKRELSSRVNLAFTYRYATGKPYTPAPDAFNTQRGPDYERLDFMISYLHSFYPNNLTVFYGAVSNVFDRHNIYDYYYSPDFSQRTERRSVFGRSVYFGVSVSF